MRLSISTSVALISALSMVGTASAWFWQPAASSLTATTSVQCSIAAATYGNCLKAKYSTCSGKTGTTLLTCMQTAAKTGTACSPATLTVCLSASCQSAVTALQQCVQKLKTACTGKTGADLETCIKQTKATGCDPGPVQACVAQVKATVSSARSSYSRSTSSRSSASRSSLNRLW